MIKYFSKLRRRKGFTLTEMIVVTAIIGLIMASVVAFSGPMRDSIKNTEARSNALTINQVLGDYIERNLAYAEKVDIFSGYDYDPTNADISKAFDDIYMSKAASVDNNTRLLVCHFVSPNPTEGRKGTMRIYDYKLTSTDSSLPSLDTLDPTLANPATTNPDYKVFIDEFYNGYQYFVSCDDLSPFANARTKKASVSMRIDSYNCGTDSDITDAMVYDYYKYIDPTDSSVTEDPFAKDLNLAFDKIGSESVNFTFENIRVETETVDVGTPGSPVYQIQSKVGNETIHRRTDGKDLVILYNVTRYTA